MPQIFKIMILTILFINIIVLIDVRHQFNNYLIINGGQYCIVQCEPNLGLIIFHLCSGNSGKLGKEGNVGNGGNLGSCPNI